MGKTYQDGYNDGYAAGRDDQLRDTFEELEDLRERISKLEWLRDVDGVRRTMREWHPDKGKKKEEASKRRENAWVELTHISINAHKAVEEPK